jgi:hypothetical protein
MKQSLVFRQPAGDNARHCQSRTSPVPEIEAAWDGKEDATMRPGETRLSRRSWLKKTTASGAALAVPYFVPCSVLGGGGSTPPSERIVVGGIGIGPRGREDLKSLLENADMQFVAVG